MAQWLSYDHCHNGEKMNNCVFTANNIQDEGLRLLNGALKTNTTLTRLVLHCERNGCDDIVIVNTKFYLFHEKVLAHTANNISTIAGKQYGIQL